MRVSCAQAPRTPSAPSEARPGGPGEQAAPVDANGHVCDPPPLATACAGGAARAALAADNHLVTCYGQEIVLVKRLARRIASG